MAVPPAYGDLGKAAKDLVNKGYNYGGTDFIEGCFDGHFGLDRTIVMPHNHGSERKTLGKNPPTSVLQGSSAK